VNPARKIVGDVSWIKQHIIHYTKCHARYGAPLSPYMEQWPILIYEHGQDELPEKNTAVCERLASRGYVVFAPYNNESDKSLPGPLYRRQYNLQHMLRRIGAITSLPHLSVGIKLPSHRYFSSFRSSKSPTIIEKLGCNMFAGRLDVTRGAGIFGHSFGATTTMVACCDNPQSILNKLEQGEAEAQRGTDEGEDAAFLVPALTCGVAIDSWMRNVADCPQRSIVKPLLLINSDGWLCKSEDLEKIAQLTQRRSDDAVVYVVTVKGTAHANFTDYPWLHATRLPGRPILIPRSWMLESLGGDMLLLGPSPPHEVWRSWTSMVESFFDKHLLLPQEASVESYASMLLFNPLFSIKIYSNMEKEEEETNGQ